MLTRDKLDKAVRHLKKANDIIMETAAEFDIAAVNNGRETPTPEFEDLRIPSLNIRMAMQDLRDFEPSNRKCQQ